MTGHAPWFLEVETGNAQQFPCRSPGEPAGQPVVADGVSAGTIWGSASPLPTWLTGARRRLLVNDKDRRRSGAGGGLDLRAKASRQRHAPTSKAEIAPGFEIGIVCHTTATLLVISIPA